MRVICDQYCVEEPWCFGTSQVLNEECTCGGNYVQVEDTKSGWCWDSDLDIWFWCTPNQSGL